MRKEYDFSKGIRGKYYMAYKKATPEIKSDPTFNESSVKERIKTIYDVLYEYEDKNQQELSDIGSAIAVLARAIDTLQEKNDTTLNEIYKSVKELEETLGL